jgi:hypothetical protein
MVRGDKFEVIGDGKVVITDGKEHDGKVLSAFRRGAFRPVGARKIVVRFENTSGDLADFIDFQAPATVNNFFRLQGTRRRAALK